MEKTSSMEKHELSQTFVGVTVYAHGDNPLEYRELHPAYIGHDCLIISFLETVDQNVYELSSEVTRNILEDFQKKSVGCRLCLRSVTMIYSVVCCLTLISACSATQHSARSLAFSYTTL